LEAIDVHSCIVHTSQQQHRHPKCPPFCENSGPHTRSAHFELSRLRCFLCRDLPLSSVALTHIMIPSFGRLSAHRSAKCEASQTLTRHISKVFVRVAAGLRAVQRRREAEWQLLLQSCPHAQKVGQLQNPCDPQAPAPLSGTSHPARVWPMSLAESFDPCTLCLGCMSRAERRCAQPPCHPPRLSSPCRHSLRPSSRPA